MSNPYESPQYVGVVAGQPEDREKLRRVARYQRWVLRALLFNILITALVMLNAIAGYSETLSMIGLVFGLVAAVAGMISICLLANEIYNIVIAIVCAVLMFVPCISLLTLAVVNGKATTYLQQRGVRVGFMGANPETI